MASAVMAVNPSRDPLYRGASEGTGLAAADLARKTLLSEESEQMQACECCNLAEECTRSYVARVRAVFCDRFVCGLCAEAIKEERARVESASMEEALSAHMNVCSQFNRAARADPLVHMANVADLMRQILRKSVENGGGGGGGGSAPNSPKGRMRFRGQGGGWRSNVAALGLGRATSCIDIDLSFPSVPPPQHQQQQQHPGT